MFNYTEQPVIGFRPRPLCSICSICSNCSGSCARSTNSKIFYYWLIIMLNGQHTLSPVVPTSPEKRFDRKSDLTKDFHSFILV
ncbi:hypothetical protein RCL_jg16494.t1 [Rhizophagus clarus]|uniref:Uncharacterized protein n=1 Tax=Rhizophagus clarus TaxID=94130 RepID=A0A8H3LN14_9GLOM|nr:hypothetical protein RCL_jg16494.t1 [Rhizophagus clarus]